MEQVKHAPSCLGFICTCGADKTDSSCTIQVEASSSERGQGETKTAD